MATIDSEALQNLKAAIQTLLPELVEPGVGLVFLVVPFRIRPTGLGGFVVYDEEHTGDIFGRRIEASLNLTLKATNAAALNEAVSKVMQGLLGSERKKLLDLGILHIRLISSTHKEGPGTHAEQELTFEILYEYLKRPEVAEDSIKEIPVNLKSDLDLAFADEIFVVRKKNRPP